MRMGKMSLRDGKGRKFLREKEEIPLDKARGRWYHISAKQSRAAASVLTPSNGEGVNDRKEREGALCVVTGAAWLRSFLFAKNDI